MVEICLIIKMIKELEVLLISEEKQSRELKSPLVIIAFETLLNLLALI